MLLNYNKVNLNSSHRIRFYENGGYLLTISVEHGIRIYDHSIGDIIISYPPTEIDSDIILKCSKFISCFPHFYIKYFCDNHEQSFIVYYSKGTYKEVDLGDSNLDAEFYNINFDILHDKYIPQSSYYLISKIFDEYLEDDVLNMTITFGDTLTCSDKTHKIKVHFPTLQILE